MAEQHRHMEIFKPTPKSAEVDLSKQKAIEGGRDWSTYKRPERRCAAHRKNGDQCKNAALRGGRVCKFHGGNAAHVRNAAKVRLEMAADRMAKALLGIATSAESEQVRLQAIKHVLSIDGISEKTAVEVEHKLAPWQDVMNRITGIGGTREDWIAQGGEQSPPPAPAEDDDILDAEVLTGDDYKQADRTARGPEHPGRPSGTPEPEESRSAPVSGYMSMDDALDHLPPRSRRRKR